MFPLQQLLKGCMNRTHAKVQDCQLTWANKPKKSILWEKTQKGKSPGWTIFLLTHAEHDGEIIFPFGDSHCICTHLGQKVEIFGTFLPCP
jgi:hypothetical protein